MKRALMTLVLGASTFACSASGDTSSDPLADPTTADSGATQPSAATCNALEAPAATIAMTVSKTKTPALTNSGSVTPGVYAIKSAVAYGNLAANPNAKTGARIAIREDSSFQLVVRSNVDEKGNPGEVISRHAGTWSVKGAFTTTTTCTSPKLDMSNAVATGDYEATPTQLIVRVPFQVKTDDGKVITVAYVDATYVKE